jgi:hypothetical protein
MRNINVSWSRDSRNFAISASFMMGVLLSQFLPIDGRDGWRLPDAIADVRLNFVTPLTPENRRASRAQGLK